MTRAQRAALLHGIYAIVNESAQCDPIAVSRAILDAGVRIVQYRAKGGIVPQHARIIRAMTWERNALFILNDAWRSVPLYDADGAHLGPDDALAQEFPAIRAALADRILGVSCGSAEEARFAETIDADYIGVGSVYATASKSDAGAPIGIAGLRAVASETRLPVAAIGGITTAELQDVRASGVAMAAVISAISSAADPAAAAHALVCAWNGE